MFLINWIIIHSVLVFQALCKTEKEWMAADYRESTPYFELAVISHVLISVSFDENEIGLGPGSCSFRSVCMSDSFGT